MKRSDRQCNDPVFFDEVFNKAEIMFVAMHNGRHPYCLPLNFVRMGNAIYIHSAKEGQKLDCIRNNGHVAFSLAVDVEIDRQKSSTYFKSVCGTGFAEIVEDPEEKRAALDGISLRYNALCPRPSPDANIKRVSIIRINIESLEGKHCGKQVRGGAK